MLKKFNNIAIIIALTGFFVNSQSVKADDYTGGLPTGSSIEKLAADVVAQANAIPKVKFKGRGHLVSAHEGALTLDTKSILIAAGAYTKKNCRQTSDRLQYTSSVAGVYTAYLTLHFFDTLAARIQDETGKESLSNESYVQDKRDAFFKKTGAAEGVKKTNCLPPVEKKKKKKKKASSGGGEKKSGE